jgi:prophage antirepressor-like protein
MSALALKSFGFGDQLVRTIDREGAIWFVANDVCAALEIVNPRHAVSKLAEDERDCVAINDAIGRERETTIISESGVYALVFKSRKPVAVTFRQWVTGEVLPAIRMTGRYEPAANDDDEDDAGEASPIPVPNMGSAEDRDNFRTAVAVIRMILQISGAQDARAYARALGFRLENVGSVGRTAKGQGAVAAVPTAGAFSAWGNAAGLKKSKLEATHLRELYQHYSRWCTGRGFNAIDPDRFKRTLDMVVGTEEHPEMYRCVMSAVRGY